jgi:arylsulfatase A-like enzyme
MATLAEVVGAAVDTRQSEDTYSFYALLNGKGNDFNRPPIVHHSVNGTFAIRDKTYKMIFSDGSGGREKPVGGVFQGPYQLYELQKDPQETNNLISREAARATKLENELELIRDKSSIKQSTR